MRTTYLLLILVGILVSCDPENSDPCSIEPLNGNKYMGFANICNGVPQNQLYFKSELTLSAFDTLILISLISQDTSIVFDYRDTLTYECVETEPNLFVFELYSSGNNIGNVGLDAKNISINLLNIANCLNNSTFDGVLIN